MKSYLVWSIVPSGKNAAFDQIMQFAAKRLDSESLQVIETSVFNVRIRPDVIPNPDYLLRSGISLAEINTGITEYEAALAIHSLMSTPGTLSIGLSSFTAGFPEFFRFLFYRNLLDPYSHEIAEECRMIDLSPYLFMCASKGGQVAASASKEQMSDIDQLNQINGYIPRPKKWAAVEHVNVIVEIVRRMHQSKSVWNFVLNTSDRGTFSEQMNSFPIAFKTSFKDMVAIDHRIGLMVSNRRNDGRFQIPVLYLGNSIPYPKMSIWLELDDPEIMASREKGAACLKATFKKPGDENLILPAVKKCLRVCPEKAKIASENKQFLIDNPDIFESIVRHFRNHRFSMVSGYDIDAGLYCHPFMNQAEKMQCRMFHQAALDEKIGFKFNRPDIAALAKRILWRNFPPESIGPLAAESRKEVFSRITNREALVYDHKGNSKPTPEAVKKRIGMYGGDQQALLGELNEYIESHFFTRSRKVDTGASVH